MKWFFEVKHSQFDQSCNFLINNNRLKATNFSNKIFSGLFIMSAGIISDIFVTGFGNIVLYYLFLFWPRGILPQLCQYLAGPSDAKIGLKISKSYRQPFVFNRDLDPKGLLRLFGGFVFNRGLNPKGLLRLFGGVKKA
jgi:hypothetical protein